MTPGWDNAWSDLEAAFGEIIGEVRAVAPQATAHYKHTTTERLPFAAYLTFSREGIAEQEDLVIAVDCLATEDHHLLACVISTGEGHTLIDGPEREIEGEIDEDEEAVQGWLDEVREFLERSGPLAARYLKTPRGRPVSQRIPATG